tara:strand:- start:1928 stop:2572 length:645 start_codon:yes stop_codon:yes gene_type:complete
MDEEITIINTNTRNEKIKNFFIDNKKVIIVTVSTIAILVIGYFFFENNKEQNKIKLANQFNSIVIDFKFEKKEKSIKGLTSIVNEQDATYSPLALYFLIDNSLIEDKNKINNLFNILIEDTNLKKEIKNLVIYKKALYNSDSINENDLMQILNPIINSESIWKSHSLYLIAEYFYSKNEKQKAKEFFNQILLLPNPNNDIRKEVQKIINRDFRE